MCTFTQAMIRVIDAGDDGSGTAAQDKAEVVAKIHDLQHLVVANAAARAIQPIRYRLLGGKCQGLWEAGGEADLPPVEIPVFPSLESFISRNNIA